MSAMSFRAVYDWLLAQCLEHRNYITSIVWGLIIQNGMYLFTSIIVFELIM